MSVLSTTYYRDNLNDLSRSGNIVSLDYMEVHVAKSFIQTVHISIGDEEINLKIEDAEEIFSGIYRAIKLARKGRNSNDNSISHT